jgi:WD40 repeat protein
MVKVKLLQITWHAKEKRKNEPILGIDFHPTLPYLATAGADCEIKIWKLLETVPSSSNVGGLTTTGFAASLTTAATLPSTAEQSVEYLYTLVGHNKSVNSVRWSPNGESLASVSDGK